MATKRMLIDATHSEETRVVVLNGNRLEDYDVEVASRKHLKGNIYLAKVTRVEPSLQAAFVDYGGNRHGFLSFNEIHPDYYQIPVTDREALIAEQSGQEEDEPEPEDVDVSENGDDVEEGDNTVQSVGGDDSDEVEIRRPSAASLRRRYKIQEVINRRQIILVQVVKEERGNKGAALTTYLSLAGRYCVLMPNTARGGGISRKITLGNDRKRLKSILTDLEISEGMAVIVRTAGSDRTKSEIRRDYNYLLRLWDSVRRLTLDSVSPTLVYEEANLIKRSIRDLYDRDIDEVVVEGEDGHKTAKNFMKLLIPSHVKRVIRYTDPVMPLFHRFQVEGQLDAMHSQTVQLRSGGYIVINPTEALVAIDVNSGRSTRERNIEETASRTNMEAAEEIARQLRLRDLAGLIVIDFIDMEIARNRIQVERRMKEAMRNDRARIQLGRISPFGLLELSRQRLRPSLLETSFSTCPQCGGTGLVRSVETAALHVLRAIEEEGIRRRNGTVTVFTPAEIALYLLNQKRSALADVEARYEIAIVIRTDESLISPPYRIEWLKAEVVATETETKTIQVPDTEEEVVEETETEDDESNKRRRRRRPRRRKRTDEETAGENVAAENEPSEDTSEDVAEEQEQAQEQEQEPDKEADAAPEAETDEDGNDLKSKRRRRGKRGGRRRRAATTSEDAAEAGETKTEETPSDGEAQPVAEAEAVDAAQPAPVEAAAVEESEAAEKPAPKRRRRRAPRKTAEQKAAAEQVVTPEAETAPVAQEPVPTPVVVEEAPIVIEMAPAPALEPAPEPEPEAEESTPIEDPLAGSIVHVGSDDAAPAAEAEAEAASGPRRGGWWQRLTRH